MRRWRLAVGILLVFLLGIPVLFPYLELLGRLPPVFSGSSRYSTPGNDPTKLTSPQAASSSAVEESDFIRLLLLGKNSFLLVAGTLAGSLLPGTFLAVVLFRSDLPFRSLFTFLLILSVFIPLPVLTSAWQALLGGQSWLPLTFWPARPGQPWTEGLFPSVWVHALAALPWVVLIMGLALRSTEPELEEDALLDTGSWNVIRHVTLPRCRPALLVAGLWVAVQTAGEVGVTDMFQYRTFAEEVFYVFGAGGDDSLAQAVALSLPATVFFWLVVLWIGPRILNAFPPLDAQARPVRSFPLRRLRWFSLVFTLIVFFLLLGVPLTTLVWNAGYQGERVGWSASFFEAGVQHALEVNGRIAVASLLGAGLTGVVTALLALLACWSVLGEERGQGWAQAGLFLLVSLLWVISGPVAGLGLKNTILWLVDFWPDSELARVLYYGPSPVPLWWAYLLRAFPFAVAVIWPVMRLIPREIRQAACLEGATPSREFLWITVPLTFPAAVSAALVVLALSLREISASKFVATPGTETFTQVVFDRMHYGVSQDVSALCLLLLALIAVCGLIVGMAYWISRFGSSRP